MQLKTHFSAIPDHRRPQGRMYDLGHLLLFSVLAVASGATSYRKIQRFMNAHRERLNELCQLHWKRAPAHNSIRYALHGLKAKEVEAVFRHHAAELDDERPERSGIAMDGKSLRGSFDRFEDRKAAQVLSALATDSTLVLGHVLITNDDGDKNHEIQAAQQLIEALGLSDRLFTLDALHTQKNS
jgi:hypothetical protein